MKKLLGVIIMILLIAGTSAAADYWHLEVGFKGAAVVPGGDYKNTVGYGFIAAFGDPDSRFTTQFEVDSWVSTYDVSGFERQYSGFGIGVFEKYKYLDFSTRLTSYIIGGVGGYFNSPSGYGLIVEDGNVGVGTDSPLAKLQSRKPKTKPPIWAI